MGLAMVPIALSPALITTVLATTSAGRTHMVRALVVNMAAATDLRPVATIMVILVAMDLALRIIGMKRRDTVAQGLDMNRGLWTVERCRTSAVVQETAATTPTARTLDLMSTVLPTGWTLARWVTIRWARTTCALVVRRGTNGRGTCKYHQSHAKVDLFNTHV